VRFGLNGNDLELVPRNGELFVSTMEIRRQTERINQRIEEDRARAEQYSVLAQQEQAKIEQTRVDKEKAWAKLREKGIDPENLYFLGFYQPLKTFEPKVGLNPDV
jgi:hypothetical protein